jgi:hypothetical protein
MAILTLQWDNMNILSKEEAVLSAGFRVGVAHRPTKDIEQWIRQTIIDHEMIRSNGKMGITFGGN